jgi:hypothetical protein
MGVCTMRKSIHVALGATIFTITAVTSGFVLAQGEFPLAGTFTRDIACRGDGKDPPVNIVRITQTEIVSSFGVCEISDIKQTGNKISVQTSCKLQSGALVTGDVVFTMIDDKNINIDDLDRNYHTKLSRCPISTAKTN